MRYDGYMKILSRLMEMMRKAHEDYKQSYESYDCMKSLERFEALMDAYSLVEEVMNEDAEAED